MRNRYSTQKNNKKNRRRGNIKTRSIQRGGAIENNNSSFGIDLTNMKESLLSQLLNIVPVNEGDDFTPEQRDEVVDYIKNSDYIKELRRSYHKPTDLQKGMQDIFDGIKAKILEYPDKWQASRLEKKNNLVANDLLQSSLDSFSSAVKEGKQMSIDKLGQLWGVVNSAKDCNGGASPSVDDSAEGGKSDPSSTGESASPADESAPSAAGESAPSAAAATGAPPADNPANKLTQFKKSATQSINDATKSAKEGLKGVTENFKNMFETRQKGGKVNVHEHPRKYIKEIKDNRKKLYEKEMEIIRSIRNFNNSHTRTHNHLHNSNKYHTRKFRRAIMK